jgi:hypothetical protein
VRASAPLQQASMDWLTPHFVGIDCVALTLTFKRRVGPVWLDEEIAQDTVRHFLLRINRAARGGKRRSPSDQLRVVAVREGAVARGKKHLHYHLQIEVPTNTSPEEFAMHCRRVWGCLDWGAAQSDAQYVRDVGWMSYMLKLRDKDDFAYAIDVDNCWLGQRH